MKKNYLAVAALAGALMSAGATYGAQTDVAPVNLTPRTLCPMDRLKM